MAQTRRKQRLARSRGVAALEFAVVFPVLFLMMYGMLSYALIFAVKYSLSHAAAEGARAAVRFSSANDSESTRQTAACQMAMQGLDWLGREKVVCGPPALAASQCPVLPGNNNVQCFSIVLNYAYAAHPLIPRLPLLPVPENLVASATTQIALRY